MVQSADIHEGSHLKKYLKHSPWYLLSSLFSKAIYFFLLPVYTRYIPPEDYGILANLESFGMLLPIFISLYMDAAFNRYYYLEKKVSAESVKILYSTHFWFLMIWGGLFSLGTVMVAPHFFKSLLSVSLWPVVVLVMSNLLNQLGVMVTLIWKANLLAKRLAIFQIIMSLIGIGVSLYLLVYLEMGWQSRIYSMGAVAILQTTILLVFAYRQGWLSFNIDISMLKRSLIFAVPLIPNIAAGWIAGFSDRIILAYYGRIDEAGLYSIAAQIAYILYVMNDSVTQVQGPLTMSGLTSNPEEAKKKMERFLLVFFAVMSLLYLGLSLFSYEILYIFTEEHYHSAWKLIAVLGYLYVISGIYRIFSNVLSFHGKNWVISSAAFIQALINIGLNFLLIPIYGMFAAALASLASLAGYLFWIIWWAQKTDPISIPWKDIGMITLLTVPVSFMPFLFNISQPSWILISVKLLAILLVVFFILRIHSLKYLFDILKFAIYKVI